MRIRLRKISKKAGLAPGSLVHIGEKPRERTSISYIDYSESKFEEKQVDSIADCASLKQDSSTVSWVNVDGIHDAKTIENIGSAFGIHSLVLEDVMNTESRPKMEEYDDYVFFVLKMFDYDEGNKQATSEQVSMVMFSNCVITFQEKSGDVFDGVRQRLRASKGTIRKRKSDFLSYSIIDSIIDRYYIILEKMASDLEQLQDKILEDPSPDDLENLHFLRREIILLRKSMWPLRELVSNFQRIESELISQGTQYYLRDLYDHTIQVIDTIDSYRDMLSSLFDMYLSNISNKTNEIMKVLTIIAMMFIPITFIAGVYGMNFEYMPELSSPYGYPAVLAAMAAISGSLLLFFRKRKWL